MSAQGQRVSILYTTVNKQPINANFSSDLIKARDFGVVSIYNVWTDADSPVGLIKLTGSFDGVVFQQVPGVTDLNLASGGGTGNFTITNNVYPYYKIFYEITSGGTNDVATAILYMR